MPDNQAHKQRAFSRFTFQLLLEREITLTQPEHVSVSG